MNAAQILADIEMQARSYSAKHGGVSHAADEAARLAYQVGMLTATVRSLCAEMADKAAEPLTQSDIVERLEALQGSADKLSADPRGYGWDAVTDAIGKAIEKVYECGSIHHQEDPRDVATARLYEVTR